MSVASSSAAISSTTVVYKRKVADLKTQLRAQQAALEQTFFQHKNTTQLLKKNAYLIDALLKKLWLQANIHQDVTLIAVGGYGRQELFPYSDIDLLILLPSGHDDALNAQIENMIGLLWDIGLNVGHSVRTLEIGRASCRERVLMPV